MTESNQEIIIPIQQNSLLSKNKIIPDYENSLKQKTDNKNQNKMTIIFRNQLSDDISIEFNTSKIKKISDLTDLLLVKLKKKKSPSSIRLFFKGRPLKNEEEIKTLSKKYFIKIFYRFNS